MRQTIILLSMLGLCFAGPLNGVLEEGPRCPIDDPLFVEPGGIPVDLPPILIIEEGSRQEGGIATGLSTLYYKYTINLLTLRIDFEVSIDTACISGDQYTAVGRIDATPFRHETIPSGPFTGTGSFQGCVANFRIEGSATLLVNLISNRISMRLLSIPVFSFTTLSANIAGLTVDGELVNWSRWNEDIKSNFEQDFTQHNTAITEKVRASANEILRQFTLAEFLELIGSGGGDDTPCDDRR